VWAQQAGYTLALLVLLTGCATFDQRAGFLDVSAAVEARSGRRLVWNSGTELDAQVAQEVLALLQRSLTVNAAVQVALLNSLELQALYAELGVAQADLVQAGLLKNPIFDGAVRYALHRHHPQRLDAAVQGEGRREGLPLDCRAGTARVCPGTGG
jgi:cobalt-zinc-cadmium efflux system outer membrane protein